MLTTVRISFIYVRRLLRKPLFFVFADKIRFLIRFNKRPVTEMKIMEFNLLLEVLTAREANGEDLV